MNKNGDNSRVAQLVAIGMEHKLFLGGDGRAFASLRVGRRRETLPIDGAAYRCALAGACYAKHRMAPSAQAAKDATLTLAAHARHLADERNVAIRIAGVDGAIQLDLGNTTGDVVQINADGWQVVPESKVHFLRPASMSSLPTPATGGCPRRLRPFVNLAADDDFVLLIAWLLQALRPCGPYPVLVLVGEQGSSKSTLSRIVKMLIDPRAAPLRSPPREERDLMVAATSSWLLAFDNLSGLRPWMSDALCRLATGGGFATRELYTDRDEVIFEAQRPVVLNGIDDPVSRSDLLDRAIVLQLPRIPAGRRRREEEFWAEFEQARPMILGGLLDTLGGALRRLRDVQLAEAPRMADFAALGAAACLALGLPESAFLDAYTRNRADSSAMVLGMSPVIDALIGFAEARRYWSGTATQLQVELRERAGEAARLGWPRSPAALSGTLKRVAPNLREIGIELLWRKEPGGRRRLIEIATNLDPSVPERPTNAPPDADGTTWDDWDDDSATHEVAS